ncbi:MAG: glycosyl hydrolase family 2 [Bacteroidetes bacterium]|nr:glycosyl hydrolase family 2 [Bacteroidota bacterium]
MKVIHILVSLIVFTFSVNRAIAQTNENVVVAPVFQDNMVLQQHTNVAVWGKGTPGMKVDVCGSWGKSASTVVQSDGKWKVKLKTPRAGGPYELTVHGGTTKKVFKNVLIGEVWLCSGQSNMEMPLEGWPPTDTIMNATAEIERAQYPSIRFLHVQRNYAPEPSDELRGVWRECTPSTARTFSAVAYFFGRKLYQTLNVPIGLILAAWGGTAVEPWMSREALQQFPQYSSLLETLPRVKDSLKVLNAWLEQHRIVNLGERPSEQRYENLQFDDSDCSKKDFNDKDWLVVNVPALWEQSTIGEFDGVVWYRTTITIPREWIGKELTLFLGPIDDMDETYVNGTLVGKIMKGGYWRTERKYTVPQTIVTDSLLTLAVRVLDTQGGGGIWGDGRKPYIACESVGQTLSLEGQWKCLPVAEYRADVFYVFGTGSNGFRERPKLPVTISGYTATALFNGMISPLLPFTIRGVIWYQGESNVYDPAMYRRLFPGMIQNWRSVFESGEFPFYYVQIAPYDYGERSRSYELRESQFLTLANVKNTGMVVTLDIGDPKNIHPCNKLDVGNRLALWALAQTYKKQVGVYSGPLYKSMKKEGNAIVLSFDHTGSGLVVKEIDGEHHFLIAGPDSIFQRAYVEVRGKKLIVSHPNIQNPLAVRYAWSNTASATLFNKEGLPASSFRTDSWK